MRNKVTLNPNGIVEITVVGNQTSASVNAMAMQAKQLLEQTNAAGEPGLLLDDITNIGTTDIAARRAVAAYAKSLPYKKVAMLGDGTVVMRVATNLLLRAAGQGPRVKYFEDRQKATAWLLARD
jgi:hypothetical protein